MCRPNTVLAKFCSLRPDSHVKSPVKVGDGSNWDFFTMNICYSLCRVFTTPGQLSVCFFFSLSLASRTVSQEAIFFLQAWIPVGVCNSKQLTGKTLAVAPSTRDLTGPIPSPLRPGSSALFFFFPPQVNYIRLKHFKCRYFLFFFNSQLKRLHLIGIVSG